MAGTLTPNQMYDHTLVSIKGAIAPRRLDFAAAPAVGEAIIEGMCCSLNSAGELIKGCPNGAVGNKPMPIFVLNSQDDFDTNSDKGNISGGVMSGLVATGAFEVESTEYATGETFAPNDLLKADGGTGTISLLRTLPYGEHTVVGVVSTGVSTNRDGISILTFWTVYLPAGADEAASESSSSDSSSSVNSSSSSESSSQHSSSSSESSSSQT